eukprot:GFUD01031020.1.p1 GENE.GFUD01031020.1~~GFUD01031020.1.p1  ORF type:complete len:480 (-),score=149.04 GFUD01031020.1:137-1576(-)
MTSGIAILRKISWPLKKKRSLAGSQESERKKSSTAVKQRKTSRHPSLENPVSNGSLEIVAPSTSDVEFKYSWPADGFVQQVKTCKADGINSKTFEINVNGILTLWNLSIRFWVDGQGERLANPFVLCLNLVGCRVKTKQDVTVKYKFGIYNRGSEEFEMGSSEKANLMLEDMDKLQSVGYKNISISDKHVNSGGDVLLSVRLSIICKEEESHSLSSDLGTLINDEKSSDLILQAGDRNFKVHRNILAARSPVFAKQLSQMEENDKDNKSELLISSDTSLLLGEETKEGNEHEEDVVSKVIGEEMIREFDPGTSSKERDRSMKKLVIPNLPSDTVEELLRYIYTDNSYNVDIFSQTLLMASDQYQLPGLKLHCERHLGENISPVNVAQILLLSDNYKCETLKKTALAYCGKKHSYIMKDSWWKIIEEENPSLFSEAISCVAPEMCDKHEDCIKKGDTRYQTEVGGKETYRKKSLMKKYSR